METTQTPQPIQPVQPVSSTVSKNSNFLTILLSVLLALSLGATGFFFYQVQNLKKQLSKLSSINYEPSTPVPAPTFLTSPQPATGLIDPTVGWKEYKNDIHGVYFRYPQDWVLTEAKGQEETGIVYNTKVSLNYGKAFITIYLNMDGIGGQPQTYEGKPYVLDGNNLYQYTKLNSYDGTKSVGISNSLTTLGVFNLNNITYSITLDYPQDYQNTRVVEEETLQTFDQILSTFQFTE